MAAIIFSFILLIICLFALWYVWRRPWLKVIKVLITLAIIILFVTFAGAAFIAQFGGMPKELIE
jgi:hypothetical protein